MANHLPNCFRNSAIDDKASMASGYYLKLKLPIVSIQNQHRPITLFSSNQFYHNGSLHDRPLFFSPPNTQLAHRRQFSTTPPAAYQTQHDDSRHRLRAWLN